MTAARSGGVRWRRGALAAVLCGAVLGVAPVLQAADAPRTELRVCADPHNLPFSNEAGEGFENRIAEWLGEKLGLPVAYTWFPQRIGFIRNTLTNNQTADGNYKCDLVIGVIDNFELAATTRPYLRSTWAMVYVKGRGLDFIQSQDDLATLTPEQKAKLRIGVWDRGAATDLVFQHDLMDQAVPFQSMSGDARESPGKIIERDLVEDRINLTFVWGPIAGYYAKRITDHDIAVIPLQSRPGLRFDFQIAMATRFPDKAWRDRLNEIIAANQAELDAILAEYGVPLLPLLPTAGGDDDDDD